MSRSRPNPSAAAWLFDGVELGLMPGASLSVSQSLLREAFTPTLGTGYYKPET